VNAPSALKIAVVGACPYPVPQGSQVYMRDTALALRDLGHEPHLVVYGYGLGEDTSGLPLHRSAAILGARKTGAGPSLLKPLLDCALVFALRRVVREQRIDVVNAHNYEALAVALASGARPIVYFAHNALSDELPYFFGGKPWAARMGRCADQCFPKRADHIVVPHARLKAHLIECGCDAERISVIPPTVDVSAFNEAKKNAELPTVLYTGNLDAYQNLNLLYRAIEIAQERIPELSLMIATAAKNTSSIPETNTEIVRTDDFTSLKQALGQDAIFACPRVSWSGYPIKLLNAMAAGLPIVCCESAAHPLTHDADGIVVPDNDPKTFAEALVALAHNPARRAELGHRARETATRAHSLAHIGTRLEDVFRGVCD